MWFNHQLEKGSRAFMHMHTDTRGPNDSARKGPKRESSTLPRQRIYATSFGGSMDINNMYIENMYIEYTVYTCTVYIYICVYIYIYLFFFHTSRCMNSRLTSLSQATEITRTDEWCPRNFLHRSLGYNR